MAPVWLAPHWVQPLTLAGSALVCVASVALVRPGAGREANDPSVAVLVLLSGAMLASPLGWVYYVPLALGPVVGVIHSGAWRRIEPKWLVVLGVLLFGLYMPPEQAAAGQPSRVATLLLASSYFWGTLGLWTAAGAMTGRRTEPA